ncbi:MAG: hypothetical protein J5I93_05230 [Pirellulaceae bacterium]|nr:hypothetical protein [Pirellulaceae bacterium]
MNRLLLLAGTGCMLAAPTALCGAQELTAANFLELHAELQPEKDSAWRTIPWKISLLDAQRTAAEQHKPIFIWAMDGHPLGCT